MSTKRNVSVLDNQAYQLQAEVMRGGKFNPTLRVRARAKAYNGYVNDSWYELVARTGIEHDKNHGNIIAEIHPRTFRGLLAAIRKLASNPGLDEKYTVTNANFVFLGGKRSEKQRITSKVGVGRNDKGVLGIMIIDMLDDTDQPVAEQVAQKLNIPPHPRVILGSRHGIGLDLGDQMRM